MEKVSLLKSINKKALREKDKDLRLFCSFLSNEAQKIIKERNKGEELNDFFIEQASLKVKKMLLQEVETKTTKRNLQFLEQFYPKQMDKDDLKKLVEDMKKDGKKIGEVMKHLSSLNEAVDKKLAKQFYNQYEL